MDKIENINDLQIWFLKNLKQKLDSTDENFYKSFSVDLKSKFEASPFWQELVAELTNYNKDYYFKTNYYLFSGEFTPELHLKPYLSFLEKAYRKNKVYNRNYPKPPKNGWITPENWFEATNDILRTTIVVRYLDGVEYILKKLETLASKNGIVFKSYKEARDEGYYAFHFYLTEEYKLPTKSWKTELKKVSIEIQITTELQDNIRKLTHKYYESRRLKSKKPNHKWQWDYKSDEFSVNYLGHILHYVEGMIMDIRNKK